MSLHYSEVDAYFERWLQLRREYIEQRGWKLCDQPPDGIMTWYEKGEKGTNSYRTEMEANLYRFLKNDDVRIPSINVATYTVPVWPKDIEVPTMLALLSADIMGQTETRTFLRRWLGKLSFWIEK